MNGYRSPDVCRLTGASYRQLDWWTRNGWVGPSIAEAGGSGSARVWSFDDVVRVAAFIHLCNKVTVLPRAAARILSGDSGSSAVTVTVDMQRVREMVLERMEATAHDRAAVV